MGGDTDARGVQEPKAQSVAGGSKMLGIVIMAN
jgi:hypothetical protein